ncbi:MAG: response regulator [Deltaproteobacteria bacterium]|nr:response regulator [Deltaproteobacteria bacterium]
MTDLDAAPVAFVELDAAHRIRRANAESHRVLGHAELVGLDFAQALSLAGRFFFQTHVYPALSRDGRMDEVYLELRAADGRALPVVMNAARRGGPEPTDVLVFLPMHRRHLRERELVAARLDAARSASGESAARARVDEARNQLAVAERLASVGELAAAVAHEINNPLAYVAANLEVLAKDTTLRRDLVELVSDVRDGVTRIRDIVVSLRKLSRIDDTRREPVDVAHVIDVALKIAGAELRHRARVEVHVDTPAPVVLADEGRLAQVLINMLVNAGQALDLGRQADNLIRVRASLVEPARCEITISDNGHGIPADLQARIFDPFFTTKPIGEGTGLGLAVCHGIVTSLGGSISVESERERGATFRIHLPALPVATPTRQPQARPVAEPERAARRRRVQVIDDEEGVGRSLRRLLREHELTWLGSSRAALERFEDDAFAGFDVVLCDLMMPQMTGMELYDRVHARSPETAAKMVFLTGGAFTEAARAFLEHAPVEVLSKPFDVNALRRAVDPPAD